MSHGDLVQRQEGGVLHLELAAASTMNALTRPLLSALTAALRTPDATVAGIVISGSDDVFSAGADFRELTGTSADSAFDDAVAEAAGAIQSSDRVVIAAVEGPCIGAAADLALACDLRVAGEGSYLQIPAVRLGLLYNPGAIDRIRRSYPRDTVRRLFLLGERFPDRQAVAAGLASCVVPRGEAVKRANALLAEIAAEQLPAMAATKQLLADQERGTADTAHWQRRRRELLDSDTRRAAVDDARRRHADTDK
jgi:enoyl-CoA hydratase